ncbi:MAG TPA: SpoIID/LytB domain-containing protein [Candidatus Acidoferrales bacterium]|nr:SpoIID/LytB domain-containing protein [Candidatus Acidoferrales bacterium]
MVVASRERKLLSAGRYFQRIDIIGQWQLKFTDGTVASGDSPLALRGWGESLLVVAQMPLEDYVAQVLDAEASAFKSVEARRAMAVAVRTYALAFRRRHAAEGFDLCDSTHCQALRIGTASAASREAAESTEGELLWYRGELAHTYYHRNCGGKLEDGRAVEGAAVPYLRAKSDTYCVRRAEEWHSEPSRDDIARALAGIGVAVARDFHVNVASRTGTGRVESLHIADRGHEQSVPEASFRLAVVRTLGWSTIQSDWYELHEGGKTLVFTGRGRGHGVGLCQAGTEQMGEAGKDYREILAFYYPGTQVGLNAAGIAWQRFAGQRVELLTTDERDQTLITTGENILEDLERRTGWSVGRKPVIKVFPTVEMYRDATGAPGWLAAETRGRTIRLQPVRARTAAQVQDTLRHELAHVLISGQGRAELPRWFHEGLVAVLSEEPHVRGFNPIRLEDLDAGLSSTDSRRRRSAYAASALMVEGCIQKSGREAVLGWVRRGLPTQLASVCAIGR